MIPPTRRPRPLLAGAAFLLAGAVLLLAAACGGDARAPAAGAGSGEGAIVVAVTVPPLAWLADEIGGDRVEVTVLLPPGTEPHAYEPSPREMAALDRATVFIAVGHPQLAFERRYVEPALAARPEIAVVRLAGGADGGADGSGAEGGGVEADHQAEDEAAGHGESDPHLWLSPARMRAAARELASVLAHIDRAGADGYRQRLTATERRIDEADRAAADLLAGLPRRRFLVVHPAWGAFAEHYGLEQVAIERHGKEPGPRELAERLDAARREGVGTVFVQQGFAERPARVIAEELDAEVVALDPLTRDWDDNLVVVARALAAELARPPARGDAEAP